MRNGDKPNCRPGEAAGDHVKRMMRSGWERLVVAGHEAESQRFYMIHRQYGVLATRRGPAGRLQPTYKPVLSRLIRGVPHVSITLGRTRYLVPYALVLEPGSVILSHKAHAIGRNVLRGGYAPDLER